jgi:hypothetical protein
MTCSVASAAQSAASELFLHGDIAGGTCLAVVERLLGNNIFQAIGQP